jgi:TPR repeat protein
MQTYYLGKFTIDGKDLDRAVSDFAKNTDGDSIYALAICYHRGYGVIQNRTEAVRLYTRASELHNADAMFARALFYQYEEGGVEVGSEHDAVRMYHNAIAENHIGAHLNLAALYYKGFKSIAPNKDEAVRLWTSAASLGSTLAIKTLASIL